MTVYIIADGVLTPVTVLAVRSNSTDLRCEGRATYYEYLAEIYDSEGNELTLDYVREHFEGDEDVQYAKAGRILMGESI